MPFAPSGARTRQSRPERNTSRDVASRLLGSRHPRRPGSVSTGKKSLTTNHAPPEALDELVRVVEPTGWVIFSIREDVYWNEGFEHKQASLEKEGRWRRVAMSEAFQPFPAGNTSHMIRLFVYQTD
jgi:hypothetical protein